MIQRGQHTYTEITTQPKAWADALNSFASMQTKMLAAWQTNRPQQIIVTGCGSTHYLAQTVAELLQKETAVSAQMQTGRPLTTSPTNYSDPTRSALAKLPLTSWLSASPPLVVHPKPSPRSSKVKGATSSF